MGPIKRWLEQRSRSKAQKQNVSKVVLAVPTLLTGGAEKFVMELATRLDPNRFRVTVLVTRGQSEASSVIFLQNAGIEVVQVGRGPWLSSLISSAIVLWRRRPDVVHTNISSIYHVSLGLLLLPSYKARVHTLHHVVGFAESGIKLLLLRNALKFLRFKVVSISSAVGESAANKLLLSASGIPQIPNGVDVDEFYPEKPSATDSKEEVNFVAVGSLVPGKDHSALIDAFARLETDIRDKCTLTILGGGKLREELDEKIAGLKLESQIQLAGNRDDVSSILRDSDVFVSASKSEGFPLSLLEGLATGLPAVITAVGGVVDIVRDGVEGILVVPGSVESMTKAMQVVATNRDLARQMGENASKRATTFSWDRCVESYSGLYESE